MAVPLIKSELTLSDVLSSLDTTGLIRTDSSGFISLVFEGNLSSNTALDVIPIADQSTTKSFVMTGPDIVNLQTFGSFTFNQNIDQSFQVQGDEELDSIVFKTAKLEFDITSTFQHSASLVLSIPGLKKQGVPFNKTVSLVYSGGIPVTVTRSFDLAGYTFDLTKGGTTVNAFAMGMQLTLVNSGNPVLNGDQADIGISFKDLSFSGIYGYVGQHNLSLDQDTVTIDIFKNVLDGEVWFEDPQINLTVHNSYGAEISGTFNVLEAYNSTKGTLPLTGSGIPNPLVFNYPTLAEAGQSKSTELKLNKNTSNIREIIALLPQYLIHQIDASVNPGGKQNYNFVLDTSSVDIDFQVILPLYGSANGFVLRDTIGFSLDLFSNDESMEVENLLFKLIASNGFPIDVGMQVYFTDSLYHTLDSLITPYKEILPSAAINSEGKVVSRTSTTSYIGFDTTRIAHITEAKYILLNAAMNTGNGGNQSVKFYSDYGLGIQMGAQAKLKVKP